MNLFFAKIHENLDTAYLDHNESHHAKNVLRIKQGELVHITDGKGILAQAKIHYQAKEAILSELQILKRDKLKDKICRLHIAIAPTKSLDRLDFFIEKAVEFSTHKISFIICKNSERRRLNMHHVEKKVINACKQSHRIIFPEINEPISIEKFLQQKLSATTPSYVAHCNDVLKKIPLSKSLRSFTAVSSVVQEIIYFIGPEGDFDRSELELLSSSGAKGVSLGQNRLRTETAGIFVASAFYFDNLDKSTIY